MAEEKSHTEQGQIERAQRLRKVINDLKEGRSRDEPVAPKKSLKEQIEDRARAAQQQDKSDSE